MIILHLEHPVPTLKVGKKAFDSDPIDRKKSGVKRYRIYRSIDDPNYVVIDLEFDNLNHAQSTLTALRNLWGRVEGTVIISPKARILEVTETKEY